jgi:hypothetical protein
LKRKRSLRVKKLQREVEIITVVQRRFGRLASKGERKVLL